MFPHVTKDAAAWKTTATIPPQFLRQMNDRTQVSAPVASEVVETLGADRVKVIADRLHELCEE